MSQNQLFTRLIKRNVFLMFALLLTIYPGCSSSNTNKVHHENSKINSDVPPWFSQVPYEDVNYFYSKSKSQMSNLGNGVNYSTLQAKKSLSTHILKWKDSILDSLVNESKVHETKDIIDLNSLISKKVNDIVIDKSETIKKSINKVKSIEKYMFYVLVRISKKDINEVLVNEIKLNPSVHNQLGLSPTYQKLELMVNS